jgi:hypothetical protein
MPILKQESFQNFIKNKYQVAAGEIIQSEEEENAI